MWLFTRTVVDKLKEQLSLETIKIEDSEKEKIYYLYDVVNNYSKEDLLRILYNYGEENFAKLILNKIIETRLLKKIETPKNLSVEEKVLQLFGQGNVIIKED